MAKKNDKSINYKSAIKELEIILSRLQKDETSVDELVNEVEKAQKLVKYCKDVLSSTEKDLDKILE